jgi:hypothetical protein
MSRGEAESTRVRLLTDCVIQVNVQNIASRLTAPSCDCPTITPPTVQIGTALSEHNYTLNKAVLCPIKYYTPPASGARCQPVYTPETPYLMEPGTEPPQGPAVATVLRSFPRITGIDQISKPLTGRSCNDRTARLRAGIISASNTRYIQSVIPIVAYPPCLPPSPKPGVPVAPAAPCNPGTRRVDYSNPRAN